MITISHRFKASFRTSSSRMIAGQLQVELGEFYYGTRRGFSIEANIRPNARLSIEPSIEFNRITLPEKKLKAGGTLDETEFDANAFGGRVSYSFSTTLFTKLFTQWSTDRDVLSANFLVNYIYRPGSDFYLVFDQNYDTPRWRSQTSRLDSSRENDILVESVNAYSWVCTFIL